VVPPNKGVVRAHDELWRLECGELVPHATPDGVLALCWMRCVILIIV
jgi:hypothetical protein